MTAEDHTPDTSRVGTDIGYGDPVTLIDLQMSDTETRQIEGVSLGKGSSHKESHLHPVGEFRSGGKPCSGCRWTEAEIIYDASHDQYVIQIIGRSIIPGDRDLIKTVWAEKPDGALRALLVPPPRNSGRSREELELPPANKEALRMAAEVDLGLSDVLEDWEKLERSGRPIRPAGR